MQIGYLGEEGVIQCSSRRSKMEMDRDMGEMGLGQRDLKGERDAVELRAEDYRLSSSQSYLTCITSSRGLSEKLHSLVTDGTDVRQETGHFAAHAPRLHEKVT